MENELKYGDLPEIFLFINSASGGEAGQGILDRGLTDESFRVRRTQNYRDDRMVDVVVHFFNLKEPQSLKEGFTRLKGKCDEGKSVILVICGGDGSVMWVVTQMANHHIDHSLVPIAIIPLGTGNDFSQTFGWGKTSPDLLANDFEKLKKRITYWLSASRQHLDIWMVEAEVQEYGKFEKVMGDEIRVLEGKSYVKHFCNYFSLGVDGKIGFSFDLHRTSTRMGNLIVYGVMGLVKGMTKTKTMGELTESMSFGQSKALEAEEPTTVKQGRASGQSVVFQEGTEHMKQIQNNENLLALNINSFMGGVTDVWRKAKVKPYLKDVAFGEQKNDDGKIEILSFEGSVSLGLEKTAGGFAEKVYQGSGPLELKFRMFPQAEKHRTYLQIDGEFVRYTHPSRLTVRRSTLSATGQILVLRRVPLEEQRGCCAC